MAIGRIETEADLKAFIEEHAPVPAQIRQLQIRFLSGTGAPSGAPKAPRAIYLDNAGGVGSTLYVWRGAAWFAVA